MTAGLLGRIVRVAAWLIFLAAFVLPGAALVQACFRATSESAAVVVSWRSAGLIGKSSLLSAAAVVLCLLLAMPAAVVLAHARRGAGRALFAGAALGCLLCPPMVYSFGWDRLLPTGVPGELRCVAIWAAWAWPIPAWLIAAGWRHGGRGAYEAALLCTTPFRAMLVATRPLLARHVLLAALILFVLFFGEYGVPHACGLIVYATELLGWAQNSRNPLDTVLPALPGMILIALLLAGVAGLWRRTWADPDEATEVVSRGVIMPLAAWIILLLGNALPIAALAGKLSSSSAIVLALQTYWRDLLWSLAVCVAAGAACFVMGWATVRHAGTRRWLIVWTVLAGALPGALAGTALVAAYNNSVFGWLYDHWPIVLLSYVGRYAWVMMLAWAVTSWWHRSELSMQAQVDGADAATAFQHIALPMFAPLLLAAASVVTVLSLSDVAACALVRVPDYNPLAHVIIEKFHRFEDDMLISLSLMLVAGAFLTACLGTWALGRQAESSP